MRRHRLPRPRVDGEDHREARLADGPEDRAEHRGVVGVRGPVDRHHRVLSGSEPEPLHHVGLLVREDPVELHGVDHDVARDPDPVPDPLALQVLDRRPSRAEEEARDMVDDHAVHLLGHGPVERPEAGLDVGHRDVELRCRESACERRVRVAVDQHQVRNLGLQDLLDAGEHRSCLCRVHPRPDAQVVIRPGDLELLEEDVRHPRVVVLARVDQDLVEAPPDLAGEGGALDELRPRPHDREHLHRADLPGPWAFILSRVRGAAGKGLVSGIPGRGRPAGPGNAGGALAAPLQAGLRPSSAASTAAGSVMGSPHA